MMGSQSWFKTGVAVALALLGITLVFIVSPSGGSDAPVTVSANHLPIGNGPDPTSMIGFVKYDDIKGEAENTGAPDPLDWIEVLSVDWGGRQTGGPSGSTRRRGAAIVDDLVITLAYEKAAPMLQLKSLKGEHIPNMQVELSAMYGGGGETEGVRAVYLKYELTNVQVTSFDVSGEISAGLPMVVVGNNFEEIKVTYTEYEADVDDDGNTILNEIDVVEYEYDAQGRLVVTG